MSDDNLQPPNIEAYGYLLGAIRSYTPKPERVIKMRKGKPVKINCGRCRKKHQWFEVCVCKLPIDSMNQPGV